MSAQLAVVHADAPDALASIVTEVRGLDAKCDVLRQEIARLEAIAVDAESNAPPDVAVDVAAIETRKRKAFADVLLKLIDRSAADAIEREAKEAAAAAEQRRADRQLRLLGAAEIRDRCQPLRHQLTALETKRDRLVREGLRLQVELRAREYRASAMRTAEALALVMAANQHLARLEHIGTAGELPRHERLTLPLSIPQLVELPAVHGAAAFADVTGVLRIGLDHRVDGVHAAIDSRVSMTAIAQAFETAGLPLPR